MPVMALLYRDYVQSTLSSNIDCGLQGLNIAYVWLSVGVVLAVALVIGGKLDSNARLAPPVTVHPSPANLRRTVLVLAVLAGRPYKCNNTPLTHTIQSSQDQGQYQLEARCIHTDRNIAQLQVQL